MSIAILIILVLLFLIGTTTAMVWAAHKEEKDRKDT
jgi:flagellar basal body-associated protein FliL